MACHALRKRCAPREIDPLGNRFGFFVFSPVPVSAPSFGTDMRKLPTGVSAPSIMGGPRHDGVVFIASTNQTGLHRMTRDHDLLRRLLAHAPPSSYHAQSRVIACPPWICTVSRLLSCGATSSSRPKRTFDVRTCHHALAAMLFSPPRSASLAKSSRYAGPNGSLVRFLGGVSRAEFAERNSKSPSKDPDDRPLADAESGWSFSRSRSPLATGLRTSRQASSEQPREVGPPTNMVVHEQIS